MFEHEGVKMRLIEEGDLKMLQKLRSDPKIWMNLGNIRMVNTEMQKEWFVKISHLPQCGYYAYLDARGKLLGLIRTDEIDLINKSIRVGGDIFVKYQGKGYGTRMYDLIFTYCFDYLNMNRVWLFVLDSNTKAISLYGKMGFQKEGIQREAIYRNGKYHGYIMMSILRSEYESKR